MAIAAILDDDTSRPTELRVVRPEPDITGEPLVPTRRLAQVIAEVLVGARPAAQLSDIAAPDVIRLLVRFAGRLAAAPGIRAQRPMVGAVHVRRPIPEAVEACALIDLGVRYRAIAFRLDRFGSRWQCTALHIG